MLVAIDGIGRVVDQAKVKFWAQAWKAAHEKARRRLAKFLVWHPLKSVIPN